MKINVHYLKALLRIAAKKDLRYYLNGVFLEASKHGGKFLVATDGHRAAVFHDAWADEDEPQDVSIIIPRETIERVKREKMREGELKRIDDDKWMLSYAQPDMVFSPIDGKFPDWRRIIPQERSGIVGQFNLSYLGDFARVLNDAYGVVGRYYVHHNGPESAALIVADSHDFLGVVMPHRAETVAVPYWAVVEKSEPASAPIPEAIPA